MENWQQSIREQFPVCTARTYMDIGLSNGGCMAALRAVEDYFAECFEGKKPGSEAAAEARELAAKLLGGVSPDSIALVKNTTEGINIIAQGFPWREGDNVVVADQEHTANLMPWLALKSRGIECRIVKSENYGLPAEAFEAAVDDRTRIVAVSHVMNATGFKNDIGRLAAFCRSKSVFLVVDAIQTLGVMPCDAKSWGVDAVAAGGHKSLLAVPGIGVLYAAPGLSKLLRPVYAGASSVCGVDREGWENVCSDETSARKLEFGSTNSPGVYALRAGLKLILDIGVDRIWENVSRLSDRLYASLREIGYNVVTPEDAGHRANIVSVAVPDPLHMKQWFNERGVAVSKMDAGYVRFSVGIFSNDADIDRAVETAREYYSVIS